MYLDFFLVFFTSKLIPRNVFLDDGNAHVRLE